MKLKFDKDFNKFYSNVDDFIKDNLGGLPSEGELTRIYNELPEVEQKKSLTPDDIKNVIEKVEYATLGVKTTACIITLKNGYEVIGTSACVDPANYNLEIGSPYAYKKAEDQIWMLEGYKLQGEL